MELTEYSNIFEKTSVYPREVNYFDMAYLYLGLMDELGELEDALTSYSVFKVLDECGDVMWYCNGLNEVYDLNMESMMTYGSGFNSFPSKEALNNAKVAIRTAVLGLIKLSGAVKKYYRDGNTKIMDLLPKCIEEAIGAVEKCAHLYNFDMTDILSNNYTKLSKRLKNNTLKGDNRDE